MDFQINLDPFTSGVITLGFIYGAYFTETFRGAFHGGAARPAGCGAGLSACGRWLEFRRILFPQMMRYALARAGE